MRGFVRGLFALTLLAWASTAHAQADFVPGQIIVKLAPATSAGDAVSLRASVGGSVERRIQGIGIEVWTVAGIGVPDVVARLRRDRRVVFAEPNYIVRAVDLFPDDPRFSSQWSLHNTGQAGGKPDADLDAPEAWTIETGNTVLVGVIDTGVDWDHADLAANIFVNPREIPGNQIDDDGNGFIDDVHGWDFINEDNDPNDDNGHGTHVAGTIAAAGNNGVGVSGVAWSARIVPIKFLSAIGTGSVIDAIRAIEYATALGVKLTNNSWGGVGYSEAMQLAIESARDAGILFVAASGNNGLNTDSAPHYPSALPNENIIAVGSSDRRDERSGFSNYGAVTVDLFAPGSDIISTFPGDRYAIASGTSMAAPHVSGAACLIWAAAPALTVAEVKDAILASVDVVPELQGLVATGGRLNLDRMLSQLDDVPPAAVLDVTAAEMGSNTASLTWTASGDDGVSRIASRYDLRYSTAPIDAGNFALATEVVGVPHPQPPGTLESFEIPGLDFNTPYYFALVVEDERGNRSPLSNVILAATLGAPQLDFAPGAFADSLLTGGTSAHVLVVRNVAEGTLDLAFDAASIPAWLRVDPMTARVYAGQSREVRVTFDATRLSQGEHAGAVVMRCNDPAQAAVSIDVALHVTDAPDIAAAPLQIDFGPRYTGTCAGDTIRISNIGALPLAVSGVTVLNREFAVDPAGFVLAVGETRALVVTFCPLAEEMTPGVPRQYPRKSRGTLVFASDDPDHPAFSIPLFGEGVAPPIVSISPPSFDHDLLTGGVVTGTIAISNSGASNLDFEIAMEELGLGARVDLGASPSDGVMAVGRPLDAEALAQLTALVPRQINLGSSAAIDQGRTTSREGNSGTRVLERLPSGNLEEVFGGDGVEALGGPRTRGNLFTCTMPTTLREHRLYMNPTATTQMWFLVYEGDEQTGVYQLISASDLTPAGPGLGWYSSGPVAVPLRAGKFYLIAASFEQPTTYYGAQNITPFPVPASFGELTAAAGWTWSPNTSFPPSPFEFVASDAFLEPFAYYQTLVTGGAIRWVSVDTPHGAVSPGTSLSIPVRFDATGVPGGDYDANLRIASNDPVTPEIVVPAHVRVTGAPDVALSESSFDFGRVFVGTTAQDTLMVSNTGTEFLLVSSIASSDPACSVDVPAFALGPGKRRLVVVTCAPTIAGPISATFTITTSDPDEGSIPVSVHADAQNPPIMSIEPASLAVDLASGELETIALAIGNEGGSDLEFEIETGETSARVVSARLSIARASDDFPRGTHAPSIGPAPRVRGTRHPSDTPPASVAPQDGFAFATETQYRQAARLRLDAPETLALFGTVPDYIWAGDFGVGDNSFAYALTEVNRLVKIDTLTGVHTMLGTIAPFGTETWSGMALDPTDGTMYAVSTDARTSSLYRLDLDTPSATRVGSIFSPAIVAVAIDDDGIVYGEDVITDELIAINKATGRGTPIGSLGFDANFGQGMAFDAVSEQLYLAAFNNFRTQAELRVADRTTGATAMVGVLGGIDPGGLLQLGWLGIPGLGGVPWMRANPRRGVVPAGASLDVWVQFDASKLNGGAYDAQLRVASNDPAALEVVVPAHLAVTGVPDIVVSHDVVDFGDVFVGGSDTRTLVVSNAGTDVLHVSDIAIEGDYAVDVTAFDLAPDAHREIAITLTPIAVGSAPATLTIVSDDVDEGTFLVELRGEGRAPPVMVVTPSSFDESLATGLVVRRTLTLDNSAGAAALIWNASARYPGDARAVLATRPPSLARPRVDPFKELLQKPSGRPAPSDIFSFAPPGASAGTTASIDASSLETILASLDARFGEVTAVIPERWDFFDGKVADGILDGGYDMFDGGNYLSTNFGGTVPYSDGVIVASPLFGANGRYFTRKYPGLFVLVAETDGVDYFEINGNLGADGFGSVDGAILQARTAGADFRGFVKRVFDANGDPSVNHMIVVQENDAATHEFATDTNSDYHRAVNLAGGRRLYYLLYSGWDSFYIDNAATSNILAAFVRALGLSPSWVRVDPAAGVVPAGATATASVVFNAAGLVGDYGADLVVAGNDPLHEEAVVTAHMGVAPAPDIAVSTVVVNFPATFVGASTTDTLTITNSGTDALTVSSIAAGAPDYVADISSFALAPTESRAVVVTFAPTLPGLRATSLVVTSNDPDETNTSVIMLGQGLEAPVLTIAPPALADTLAAGATASRVVNIANLGGNDLDVQVTVEGAPSMPAARAIAGGGPDFGGYRWEDSNDVGGPAFAWIDAATGADVGLANDGFVEGIPLGFAFRYYGGVFTTVTVGANGWLSFNGGSVSYPASVPQADFVAGAIAPYARDLAPTMGAYVRYLTLGSAPDRRFVVEYNAVPDGDAANPKTFEVVLYERTNTIRFQYLTAPNAPEGFGIESPDESLGLGNGGAGETFIDVSRVADNYAIEFFAPPVWLRLDPLIVTVPAGGNVDLAVTLDATGLPPGNYDARIALRSNDPVTPFAAVPVALAVEGARSISDIDPPAIPTKFALHSNRPNPFNPTTTIAYDLPRAGEVRLAIYDVRGREVRVLKSGQQPAGRHQIVWDGRNAKSEPAASGVYFYRLVAGDFVETRKMVLLK